MAHLGLEFMPPMRLRDVKQRPRPARRQSAKTAWCAQWGRGSGSDGVADESFSKFPYRTRRPMCAGDDGLERLLDPTAILYSRDRE